MLVGCSRTVGLVALQYFFLLCILCLSVHLQRRGLLSDSLESWTPCPGCILLCSQMRRQPQAKQHMLMVLPHHTLSLCLENRWLHSHPLPSVQTGSRHSVGSLVSLTSPEITSGFIAYLFWLNSSDFSKVHAWLERVCNLNDTCLNLNISRLMWVYLVCMKRWSSQHVKQFISDSQYFPPRLYLIYMGSS